MQLYKYDTNRDGTRRQAEGRSVDAALLVEELVKIYSILLQRVGVKPEK